MKKIIYILLVFLFVEGYGQTIKLVRTDVDSTRSSFVTATYLFGIDIYASGLKRCNGVSFGLTWNKVKYVTFSEAVLSEFSSKGTSIVTPPQINYAADVGKLFVGVLSGDSVGAVGTDDPMIIHLEFAVSQTSTDGDFLTFNFDNIQAVVTTDNGGEIINIETEPISYRIHGFVDVWPGDADNNGVVDQSDMSTMGLFLKYGSSFKNMRSFKRQPTSTIWVKQRALGWDTLQATYADCDGNGDVTVTDMLVIGMNFSKTHGLVNKNQDAPQSIEFIEEIFNESNYFKIPVKLKINESIKGLAGEIIIPDEFRNNKLIGVNRGNIFKKDNSYFFYKKYDNSIDYAFISKLDEIPENDIICYLLFEKPALSFNILAENNILNSNNSIYPVKSYITDIKEENTNNAYNIIDNIIYSNESLEISLFDYLGYKLDNFSMHPSQHKDLNNLNSGVYFLRILNGGSTQIEKVIIN